LEFLKKQFENTKNDLEKEKEKYKKETETNREIVKNKKMELFEEELKIEKKRKEIINYNVSIGNLKNEMKLLKEISLDSDLLFKQIKYEKKNNERKIRELKNEVHNEIIQKHSIDDAIQDFKRDMLKYENELTDLVYSQNEKIYQIEDNYLEEIDELKKLIEEEKETLKSQNKDKSTLKNESDDFAYKLKKLKFEEENLSIEAKKKESEFYNVFEELQTQKFKIKRLNRDKEQNDSEYQLYTNKVSDLEYEIKNLKNQLEIEIKSNQNNSSKSKKKKSIRNY
jgi:chromosome segregation ATPase